MCNSSFGFYLLQLSQLFSTSFPPLPTHPIPWKFCTYQNLINLLLLLWNEICTKIDYHVTVLVDKLTRETITKYVYGIQYIYTTILYVLCTGVQVRLSLPMDNDSSMTVCSTCIHKSTIIILEYGSWEQRKNEIL